MEHLIKVNIPCRDLHDMLCRNIGFWTTWDGLARTVGFQSYGAMRAAAERLGETLFVATLPEGKRKACWSYGYMGWDDESRNVLFSNYLPAVRDWAERMDHLPKPSTNESGRSVRDLRAAIKTSWLPCYPSPTGLGWPMQEIRLYDAQTSDYPEVFRYRPDGYQPRVVATFFGDHQPDWFAKANSLVYQDLSCRTFKDMDAVAAEAQKIVQSVMADAVRVYYLDWEWHRKYNWDNDDTLPERKDYQLIRVLDVAQRQVPKV